MPCGDPVRSPLGLSNELDALEAFEALLTQHLDELQQNPLTTQAGYVEFISIQFTTTKCIGTTMSSCIGSSPVTDGRYPTDIGPNP